MTGLLRAVRAEVPGTCILEEGAKRTGAVSCLKTRPGLIWSSTLTKKVPRSAGSRDVATTFSSRTATRAPVELKRGSFRAGEVVEQLRAGAAAAEKIVPENLTVSFCPVVVGSAHKEEMYKLRKKGVSFRGRRKTVRSVRCGGRFTAKLCA